MKISVCMIVKNEAELLQRSLRPLRRYADDLVIVDTGSTDHTKKIAGEFTTKVYDFSWCNDFAAARNFSLDQAAFDWVFVLDADEVVIDFNCASVEKLLSYPEPAVGRIKLINILSDPLGERRTSAIVSRLFNRRFFHYDGIIHEQIIPIQGQPYVTLPLEVLVEHHGYKQEVVDRTHKVTRNITLLQQALGQRPTDPYLLYQLGKTYVLAKNFPAAVGYFVQALTLPLDFSLEYTEDLVESYGYALLNAGNYVEALHLELYSSYYLHSPDFLFLQGLIAMNNSRFAAAITFFSQCLAEKSGKVEGINSWLPHYNMAVIYECLGNHTAAIQHYREAQPYQAAESALVRLAKFS